MGEKEPRIEVLDDESDEREGLDTALQNAIALKQDGNAAFKAKEFERAIQLYEDALRMLPPLPLHEHEHAVVYCNLAAAYLGLQHHDEVESFASKALDLEPRYEKALLRRCRAREATHKYKEAIEDMNTLLELNPHHTLYRTELKRLTKTQEEYQEKQKEEMLSKLKDMGNSVLGRFGMSLDNFKATKDPATGSYSINFQQ